MASAEPKPGARRRRRLVIAGGAAGGLLAVLLVAGWLLYPRVGAWAIRSKVVPRLEARLDREVAPVAIDVERGRAVLRDVVVRGPADEGAEPLARLDEVIVEYDFWASLVGDVVVHRVVVDGLQVALRRGDEGDNFGDVLARLRDRSETGGGGSGGGGLRPDELVIRGAGLALRDSTTGVTTVVDDIGAVVRDGRAEILVRDVAARTSFGPELGLERLAVTTELAAPIESAEAEVRGGRVTLWEGMTLTGAEGTVSGTERAGRLSIDLTGGYGGVEGRLWSAEGWLDPAGQSGALDLVAERFTLDRIAPVLEGSPVVDYRDTTVDAEVHVALDPREATIDGRFALTDLDVQHELLAPETVRDLDVSGTFRAGYDRRARRLYLAESDLRSRGVDFRIDGALWLPGGIDGDGRRAEPRVEGHLVIPPVDCQTVLEAIPREMATHLQGMEVRGTFDTDVHVAIDWADLDATELGGSIGVFQCKHLRHPEKADARELKEAFTHHVEDGEGGHRPLLVGMANPDFVPIWEVSPHLVNSLMTTEDSRFYDHNGFIPSEFRTALVHDLKAGYFKYGASSITMQMVKNVFLYREKTLSRKLQELVLTWYVEQELDKDRIMEIYINAIEYGPGIYGIGHAAREYFGKHARELDPREAAFFSSTLPDPKDRYKQYCRDQLWNWIAAKIERIIDLMHERDRLDEIDYQLAKDSKLVFDRSNVESEWKCIQRADEYKESAASTRKPSSSERGARVPRARSRAGR